MTRSIIAAPPHCESCMAPYPPVAKSHGWQIRQRFERTWMRVPQHVEHFRTCPECSRPVPGSE